MSLDRLDPARLHALNRAPRGKGPVLHWMSRDLRPRDHWGLAFAEALARDAGAPLAAVFCLAPHPPGASRRVLGFLLRGLAETGAELEARGIPFLLLPGEAPEVLPRLVRALRAGAATCDFDPLPAARARASALAARLPIPLWEVDAHNLIPARFVTDRAEWGARTLRPKIRRLRDRFSAEPPPAPEPPVPVGALDPPGFDEAALRPFASGADPAWADRRMEGMDLDPVPETGLAPGPAGGEARLRAFLAEGLSRYALRNDPNAEAQSGLSPWLHFGFLAPQRAVLEAEGLRTAGADPKPLEAFLEELIVRRELSDNFCLHRPCGSPEGFPEWGRRTLAEHEADPRPRLYAPETLEEGRTEEALWNAAQLEMVRTGRMAGTLRMYWAKRLLDWTRSAREAQALALALNDRYALDGRDPNGCAGIAWSLGGLHDRPFREGPVRGKIRPMTESGCRRKFDVDRYVRRVAALPEGPPLPPLSALPPRGGHPD